MSRLQILLDSPVVWALTAVAAVMAAIVYPYPGL